MGIQAWVDESIHLDVAPRGIYVLAATIGEADADLDGVRDRLLGLVPGSRRRLHWHVEDNRTRALVIDTIVDLGLNHLVVARSAVDPKRQERARRKCLERLLFELSECGVSQVCMEGRDSNLNRSDRELIAALRGFAAVSPDLAMGFARPLEEPMLWVPDAVAGAVTLARKGRDGRYRQRLGAALEEVEV